MDVAPAVEQRREPLTPAQRFARATAEFLQGLLRLTALSAPFTALILGAFLTIDIPVYALDHLFVAQAYKPSVWLTWGQIVMAFGTMAAVLISRKYGGDEAARVVTVSWGLAALAVFAELAYLAPVLEPGDFPSLRVLGAFVASAMVGQYLAAGFYDVARGGGAWWRAPFYALLCGFLAHVVLYFAVANRGGPLIWLTWMVTDFGLKAAMATGFLVVYHALRRRLRPRGGYGG